MSDMLIPSDIANQNEDKALAVSSSGDYFARLKLCQSNAKEVQKRIVSHGGNYALVIDKDEIIDLGEEVEVVVIAGRAKAMSTTGSILTYFDPESEEFKDIQNRSRQKNSGCMYGPDYLVWIPSVERFATFFLNSATARRESKKLHAQLRQAALLKSDYIEGDEHSWFGPVFEAFPSSAISVMPDMDELRAQVEKFENEKPSVVKIASEDSDTDRVR